jgi:hypothetical protein
MTRRYGPLGRLSALPLHRTDYEPLRLAGPAFDDRCRVRSGRAFASIDIELTFAPNGGYSRTSAGPRKSLSVIRP